MALNKEAVQATAAALCVFGGPGDSLLPGFVVAQFPAAVPDLASSFPMRQRQTRQTGDF